MSRLGFSMASHSDGMRGRESEEEESRLYRRGGGLSFFDRRILQCGVMSMKRERLVKSMPS